MWTGLIFLNLLGALHCTVSSSPPSPINVIFSSVNLKNVLQWFPGSGTPDDTHFIVQYAIYGESVEGSEGRRVHWRKVRRCTEIVRSWCDLSNETKDLEQGYYARVRAVSRRASSKWVLTGRRFDPKTDTSFGPPLVSVEIEDNNAIITLKGPMRYPPNNHTQAVFMQTLYPHMIYNLSIVNTRRRHIHHSLMDSHSYKFRLMEYNTEYCFSAKTSFLYMPAHCLSSAWHCITTPQDPVIGQLQRVVVAIIVPSVCICMMVVVGYLLYRYLSGKGQKSPYILNPPAFHQTSLTFPPEKPKLLVITIIKDLHPDPEAPPPGYAFQRPQTPPALEEPWDDLSVDYGFTAAAPNLDARGEDRNNTKVQHEKCAAYEKKGWKVEEAGWTHTDSCTVTAFSGSSYGRGKRVSRYIYKHNPKNWPLTYSFKSANKVGRNGERDGCKGESKNRWRDKWRCGGKK
ncbi:interleukin-20 receptor subunit alpha [Cottoperca gobio]|uniref:Interleukin-20 receptor subunit alpha n=1 Tax=Cottoperca gobio TaxID=56716 RepID=A0A6J2P8N0_COTGO|nr:interleukin-20 receptor subunit alpha-like [Cottoperca gobio]